MLLTPTFIYTDILSVLCSGKVLAAAHITGGGLINNLRRVIPDNLKIVLDKPWPIPDVFGWLTGVGMI